MKATGDGRRIYSGFLGKRDVFKMTLAQSLASSLIPVLPPYHDRCHLALDVLEPVHLPFCFDFIHSHNLVRKRTLAPHVVFQLSDRFAVFSHIVPLYSASGWGRHSLSDFTTQIVGGDEWKYLCQLSAISYVPSHASVLQLLAAGHEKRGHM